MHGGTRFFGCMKPFLKPSKSSSLDLADDEPGLFPPHVKSHGHKDWVTPPREQRRERSPSRGAHICARSLLLLGSPPADCQPLGLGPSSCPRPLPGWLPESCSELSPLSSPRPCPTASRHTRAGSLNLHFERLSSCMFASVLTLHLLAPCP